MLLNTVIIMHLLYRRVSAIACCSVKNIAISAAGLGFNSRAGQIGQCYQRLATAAMFFGVVLSRR